VPADHILTVVPLTVFPTLLLLSLSFTPDLITVILSTTKSLSLNYPTSSRYRILLLVLLLKLPSPVISLPSYALSSLHWLRITERIEYKLLSLTYKVLTTTQPPYLHNLISTQRPRSNRSASVVTFARQPRSSSLKITDCSFRYASPCLCNQLPLSLHQPHSGTSSSISDSPIPSPITSSSSDSPPCSSITSPLFHSFTPSLKPTCFTNFNPHSFTSSPRTAFTDFCLHRFF